MHCFEMNLIEAISINKELDNSIHSSIITFKGLSMCCNPFSLSVSNQGELILTVYLYGIKMILCNSFNEIKIINDCYKQ